MKRNKRGSISMEARVWRSAEGKLAMSNSRELQAFVKAAKEQGATDEFLVACSGTKAGQRRTSMRSLPNGTANKPGLCCPCRRDGWRQRAKRSFICSRL